MCPATSECLHLISEGNETTGTRESANQGRLCVHTHSPVEAYHKKEWVEAGNTRIPTGRGNPPTKKTPTDKRKVKEGGEATRSQPRTYLKTQINSEEITKNKQLNKNKRKASKPCTHGRTSSNTTCPQLHNRKQEVGERLTLR